MKLLAFMVVLAIGAKAVVMDPRQTCKNPSSDISSLPSECQGPISDLVDVLANISQPVFTNATTKLDAFCMKQCVQPYVDYYTCLGETDYANVLDGFLCGKYDDQYCFQLWKIVFSLNGTNPNGISYNTITKNCDDPLYCNSACSTELNKAKSTLGCCLAGIVEFSACNALAKVRYEECSIQIPPICEGVASTPTTPAPEYPTAGTDCVHPQDDVDYPADCKNKLTAVETLAITHSSGGFTSYVNSTNITASLNSFCTPECVRPLVAYYNCTGEPGYAKAINGFICGQYNNQYCLIQLPTIFQRPNGTGGPVSIVTINTQCNDVLSCSTDCMTELTEATREAGCCLPGAVEFTVCGPLEQARFDECGISIGNMCPGVDLSGGTVTVPFTLTVLGIIAFLI